MKALLPALLLTLSTPAACYAQGRVAPSSASGCQQLPFILGDCSQARALAERDIQAGAPFLVLASGLAPATHPQDCLFEHRYQIYYFDEGCTAPAREYMVTYNYRIFDYLQATFGKQWRRAVRPDVVGYKEWKRKH